DRRAKRSSTRRLIGRPQWRAPTWAAGTGRGLRSEADEDLGGDFDPGGPAHRDRFTVGAEQGRLGTVLAAVAIRAPGRDDTALAGLRAPVDAHRLAAEQDVRETPGAAVRVGGRAVERRPHELGRDLAVRRGRIRRGDPRGRD